jgi:hypothetical protein
MTTARECGNSSRTLERGLPDQLGHQHFLRLVGQLTVGVERRPGGSCAASTSISTSSCSPVVADTGTISGMLARIPH